MAVENGGEAMAEWQVWKRSRLERLLEEEENRSEKEAKDYTKGWIKTADVDGVEMGKARKEVEDNGVGRWKGNDAVKDRRRLEDGDRKWDELEYPEPRAVAASVRESRELGRMMGRKPGR